MAIFQPLRRGLARPHDAVSSWNGITAIDLSAAHPAKAISDEVSSVSETTTPFRYAAFISYSHKDAAAAAKWLHKSIEGFRLDKELIGVPSPLGPIPKLLAPVFRDRDDFTAGHSLKEQTRAALDAAASLIVIASPDAARSRYVNEEVRLFRARHPERPVIPLIVRGKPGGGDEECSPPALRFRIGTDGAVTDEPEEAALAADWREEADGRALALAKIVACLTGRSTDDIFRRAERARRRASRRAVIAKLEEMTARGILLPADEPYIAAAKQNLVALGE